VNAEVGIVLNRKMPTPLNKPFDSARRRASFGKAQAPAPKPAAGEALSNIKHQNSPRPKQMKTIFFSHLLPSYKIQEAGGATSFSGSSSYVLGARVGASQALRSAPNHCCVFSANK
jgi:hypothetical protein